ncbi:tRNA-specific adenosine-34 deaminase [Fructilactobacillus florum 8D]|uniref:tRNA-specific adenosine deaminase n=1 Tax=Fructilactobacillus florum 8D TaxID=1221538 RepID=W9EDW0_9LACO|nr:nucleoside deaminase [Fructilactobacillus florum]ETO40282.1 tRNA-specific adenosine-34 deaminase [Fructilactobacillus florum 8D]
MNDDYYMRQALKLGEFSGQVGEIPIGAVVVFHDQIIGTGHNLREHSQLATQHAELIALDMACQKLHSWRLDECTLYVTIEPCLMCAGAILNARVARVVYGAMNPKAGAVKSLYHCLTDSRQNHQVSVRSGVQTVASRRLMQSFFKNKRQRGSKD